MYDTICKIEKRLTILSTEPPDITLDMTLALNPAIELALPELPAALMAASRAADMPG